MRHTRKRFTKSAARSGLDRPLKRIEGQVSYRHSESGRYAMREALGEQRRRQQNICPLCSQPLAWEDAKFELKKFSIDQENRAIHRKCPEVLA